MSSFFSLEVSSLVPFCFFPCFWVCSGLNNLKDNLEVLQKDMQTLSETRDDLSIRVSREKDSGLLILPEVTTWFLSVRKVESEAYRLLDESISAIPSLKIYGYCSLLSKTREYCKKVYKVSEKVNNLTSLGAFEVVSYQPIGVQKLRLVPPTKSQEKLLESIWIRLGGGNVGTLGIYGYGGVGKTTLLAQLNNKLSEVSGGYDLVIFVVVASKDIETLQDEIGNRLGILRLLRGLETKKEKAAEILGVLKRKRFALLLDNVRERVDLEAIGVPYPSSENGCKVVFTAHSAYTYRANWVDTSVEVSCLPPDEARDLFLKTVGGRTLTSHPDIPALARIAAEKCHGYPLALIIIGKTMSRKTTIQKWRYAIHVLSSSRYRFSGGFIIYPILTYSYFALPDEITKTCFLYCALFPEGVETRRQDLVKYWVGEGLVSDDIKGYEVIDHLVGANLLVEDESGYGVKMHDSVREMALWIASDDLKERWLVGDGWQVWEERQKECFVVKEGEKIQHLSKISDGKTVKRISVTYTHIENISDSPNCSELTTLFLQHNNNLKQISSGFFRQMVSLVVLDLSHNRNLSKLPEEVSCLVSLRFLNLSWTRIKDLPNGLRVLIQLIHLDLESTSNLSSISLISGLLNLQVLRFYGSGAALDISLLKNLERLKDLKLLTVSVREVDALKTFLQSRLSGCTQGLYLEGLRVSGVSGQSFAATMGALSSLRNVEMVNCDIIESEMEWKDGRRHQYSPSTSFNQITPRSPSTSSNQTTPRNPWFMNLSTVVLLGCQHLKDLTWLIYAANLESLSVESSLKMEEVISKEKAACDSVETEPFLKLQVLRLENLPTLKSIYGSSLSFPKLRKVDIKNCPILRKLPFNSTSVERIDDLEIEMDDGWMDRIVWENEAEYRFLPIIRPASGSQLNPVK